MDFDGYILHDVSWEEDQEAYEYREWCDNGGAQQAYVNKKCNKKKDCPNNAVYTILINDHFSKECSCEQHRTKDYGSIKHVKFISDTLKSFI
jgi:hypothetical protein